MSVVNLDKKYQAQSLEYNQARAGGIAKYYKGHYQGTTEAFKSGFCDGAILGALFGFAQSIYFRKFKFIPKLSLVCGASYGTIMMIS